LGAENRSIWGQIDPPGFVTISIVIVTKYIIRPNIIGMRRSIMVFGLVLRSLQRQCRAPIVAVRSRLVHGSEEEIAVVLAILKNETDPNTIFAALGTCAHTGAHDTGCT
jgi:hypothetical protein